MTLADLEERREELTWAIDDAAEADDGDEWECLNDELDDVETEIEKLEAAAVLV